MNWFKRRKLRKQAREIETEKRLWVLENPKRAEKGDVIIHNNGSRGGIKCFVLSAYVANWPVRFCYQLEVLAEDGKKYFLHDPTDDFEKTNDETFTINLKTNGKDEE